MKRYKVYVYNTVDKFWDCYEVLAEDPVDARNVAVQRLIDETGHGLDVYEVTDVCEIKGLTGRGSSGANAPRSSCRRCGCFSGRRAARPSCGMTVSGSS